MEEQVSSKDGSQDLTIPWSLNDSITCGIFPGAKRMSDRITVLELGPVGWMSISLSFTVVSLSITNVYLNSRGRVTPKPTGNRR